MRLFSCTNLSRVLLSRRFLGAASLRLLFLLTFFPFLPVPATHAQQPFYTADADVTEYKKFHLCFRFVFLFVLVVMSASIALSQPKAKPNFSGTWLLDRKKSNDAGLTTRPDLPIKITHQEPEFRVTRSSDRNGQIVEHDFTYFTDGRGEENEATSLLTTNPSGAKADDLKNRITKSKTKWSGNKVITRALLRMDVAGHFVEFEQVDEWKISDDGKVLTQTSRVIFQNSDTAFIPAMAQDKKRVYNRR